MPVCSSDCPPSLPKYGPNISGKAMVVNYTVTLKVGFMACLYVPLTVPLLFPCKYGPNISGKAMVINYTITLKVVFVVSLYVYLTVRLLSPRREAGFI